MVWSGAFDCNLQKLDDIQVEALRIVTGATANSSIQLLYSDTGWEHLSDRRKIHSLCIFYQIMQGTAPHYLRTLIPQTVGEATSRNLRSASKIRMPKTRTETFRRSFIPSTINLWNSLDPSLKNKPLLSSIKISLSPPKDPMTNRFYYGKRWPSIHHARLRIGCSKLNSHLYHNLHVIPSPNCSCGYHNEDPTHFFFSTALFYAAKNCIKTSCITNL